MISRRARICDSSGTPATASPARLRCQRRLRDLVSCTGRLLSKANAKNGLALTLTVIPAGRTTQKKDRCAAERGTPRLTELTIFVTMITDNVW